MKEIIEDMFVMNPEFYGSLFLISIIAIVTSHIATKVKN